MKEINNPQALKSGIELIEEERKEQIERHGYVQGHDDFHDVNEIAWAAVSYAMPYGFQSDFPHNNGNIQLSRLAFWPWDEEYFKPSNDRIKELKKAGALIAAEIDRLQRLKQRESE